MWTSTMDLDLKRVLLTQLIGRFYRNIYFSSYSPLQVQNLPRQSLPASDWVRVRNSLAGISGSDIHQLYNHNDIRGAAAAGPDRRRIYPGHELVGEVIEIGDDVRHLNVGDRVALQYGPNCVTAGVRPLCHACASGNFNLCEQGAFLAEPPLGGGWCEEVLLNEQQLYRVPETLTDEQAVMLEPTAVAMHAVLRYLPQSSDRVLIIGTGTVGLITQQIVHALAPHAEISMLARYPFQVELATRQGAAHIIYPHDAYNGVQHATNARLYRGLFGNQTLLGGYDIIYDTVGSRKTLHHALRWTRSGGAVVLIGLSNQMMNVDFTPLWNQEISLLGSLTHGMEIWPIATHEQHSTFAVATELIEHGRIAPERLITHHFALNNYKSALLTATNKADSRAVKVVFDYSLLPASVVPNVRASAPRIRRQATVDFNSDSSSGYFPTDTTGQSAVRSGNYIAANEQSGAQRFTATRRPRYTQQVESMEDEDEDEATASALPAIPHRATHERRAYTTSSRPTSSSLEDRENATLPRPQEYTRERHPTSSLPDLPVTPAIPSLAEEESQQDDGEESSSTQLVSRDEILHHLTGEPAKASDSAPIGEASRADDEKQPAGVDMPSIPETEAPATIPEDDTSAEENRSVRYTDKEDTTGTTGDNEPVVEAPQNSTDRDTETDLPSEKADESESEQSTIEQPEDSEEKQNTVVEPHVDTHLSARAQHQQSAHSSRARKRKGYR